PPACRRCPAPATRESGRYRSSAGAGLRPSRRSTAGRSAAGLRSSSLRRVQITRPIVLAAGAVANALLHRLFRLAHLLAVLGIESFGAATGSFKRKPVPIGDFMQE